MTKTVHAIFDGKVFHPEGTIDLKINRRYRLKIEPLKTKNQIDDVELDSAYNIASLTVNTEIPDLASNHDHYLYRTPKRG
jgi:hypothetical protein